MLSEGRGAKNVTHTMGLRAFTSQLLCEQVIGRGVSHDTERVLCPDGIERELFAPEHVNVFGVPLSIFQDTKSSVCNDCCSWLPARHSPLCSRASPGVGKS